jgi:AsmA protein
MRRFALLVIGAVALIALVAAAVANFASADRIKMRIAENIAALTGRQVVLKGAPVLTVYPSIAITVGDLTIANPDGTSGDPLLTSESVTARVRLLPLLMGNAQFDSIELTKPRIHLVANADGRTNFTLPAAAGSTPAASAAVGSSIASTPAPAAASGPPAPVASAAGPSPPRRIKITAGTVVYDEVATSRHEEVSELDLEATWPDLSSPLVGTGTARWRGELVDFNGQLGDPLAAAGGAASPFRLALAAKPIRIAFNGTLGPSIDGAVTVSTPALRRLLEWTGAAKAMGSGPTLGAASIQGKLDWMGRDISLADATVELDGNSGVGAFTYDYAGQKPLVEGTLAAGQLDLSPYLDGLKADAGALLGPAALPFADVVDLDLRVSSNEVLVGPLRFTKAAAAVAMRAGNLTLNVVDASLYGGSLTADAKVTRVSDRLVSEASVKLTNVAAGSALTDLAGIQSLDGAASGSLDVRTQGASWGEFVQGLTARGSFTVQNGTLSGLDVNDLASLADAPAVPLAPGAGSMTFAKLAGTVTLDAGILETKDTVVSGGTYRIDLRGWGSLATGLIEAGATLGPATGGASSGKVVPIAISGSWRRPLFDLDRGRNGSAPPVPPRG